MTVCYILLQITEFNTIFFLIFQQMLNQRKSWTHQEDQLLINLFQQYKEKILSQTLHWNFIAQKLNSLNCNSNRSGKQCRQRWLNQLNPEINKNTKWTEEQKSKLVDLHDLYGNRWALIAKHFDGRTDNSIKNYMNSILRKALRLLNLFVSKNRKFKQFKFKNLKEYKVDLLNKILFFSGTRNTNIHFQEDFLLSTFTQNKQKILPEVYRLSANIKRQLMSLQTMFLSEQINLVSKSTYAPISCFQNLINKIHQLNAICKKRKQKRIKNQNNEAKKTHIKSLQKEIQSFNFHSGIFVQKIDENLRSSTKQQEKHAYPKQQQQLRAQKNIILTQSQKTANFSFMNQNENRVFYNQVDVRLRTYQIQNNEIGIHQEIKRQSEQVSSVKSNTMIQNASKKQNEITVNVKSKKNNIGTIFHPIDSNYQKGRYEEQISYKKLITLKTNPTITSLLQKSKDSYIIQSSSLSSDQQNSVSQQEDYFVFSDIVEEQNYLPLYPTYKDVNVQNNENQNQQITDFYILNSCQVDSEQEVI